MSRLTCNSAVLFSLLSTSTINANEDLKIWGLVRDKSGEPVPRVKVSAYNRELNKSVGHDRTDKTGRYEFTCQGRGKITLEYFKSKYTIHYEELTIHNNEPDPMRMNTVTLHKRGDRENPRVAEINRLRELIRAQEAEKLKLELKLITAEQEARSELAANQNPDIPDSDPDIPPDVQPGECYARVFESPIYATETKEILKSEASHDLEIIHAEYKWVEETVLIKEASTRYETVPPKYEWVEETIVVEPQRSKLVKVPAQYETTTEQILIRPAYTTWKKGRGPIERIDEATGEIMCLVEVPAEYKSVIKRTMLSAPETREEIIPAVTKTIRKQVMTEPAKTFQIEIPAEYETIKVRKLLRAAQERRIDIPAEYQTVTERKLVNNGAMRWQSILCETNTSPKLISRIQRALKNAGFDPGPIDGVLGIVTMTAINDYQVANNLTTGQLTIETIKSLGVNL